MVRHHRFGQETSGANIHVEQRFKMNLRDLLDGQVVRDARVVDEQVDSAQKPDRFVRQRLFAAPNSRKSAWTVVARLPAARISSAIGATGSLSCE